jgi:hypothetical protein
VQGSHTRKGAGELRRHGKGLIGTAVVNDRDESVEREGLINKAVQLGDSLGQLHGFVVDWDHYFDVVRFVACRLRGNGVRKVGRFDHDFKPIVNYRHRDA